MEDIMGLLNYIFGHKGYKEKTEQRLYATADALVRNDPRAARMALMEIAQNYKKRDNDTDVAEAVMWLVAC
jgi:hypothetical protein